MPKKRRKARTPHFYVFDRDGVVLCDNDLITECLCMWPHEVLEMIYDRALTDLKDLPDLPHHLRFENEGMRAEMSLPIFEEVFFEYAHSPQKGSAYLASRYRRIVDEFFDYQRHIHQTQGRMVHIGAIQKPTSK